MTYYCIGEWLIEENDHTLWIYRKDVCYARFTIKKYKRVQELKIILERFLRVVEIL